MSCSILKKHKQKGATLLVFALLLIVGSTYTLILKLNSETNFYARQSKETQRSLRLAKQALMGYALMFPEKDATSGTDAIGGPGYLPCPDTNNDGRAVGSCSASGRTTIGRLPYQTLELPELKDASGNHLWYALSDNYRNNPALEPLNSETKGQLTVDGHNDIVAVVIAPGVPIVNQDRDPNRTDIQSEIAHYLEGDNNDLDTDFTATNPDSTGFNDLVISITRQELMRLVEKRVSGEIKVVLSNYRSLYSAYPWLSVFADPKAVASQLTGSAGFGSSSTTLKDRRNDFDVRQVSRGDTIYNITDGSVGLVDSVNQNSLGITGLSLGTENDFDEDDKYVIVPQKTAESLSGTTSSGDHVTLLDNSRDLSKLGIAVGDVIDNITDGSSGMITSISKDSIELDGLVDIDGEDKQFQMGDEYQIRNNYGMATNATTNKTQLVDEKKDFIKMGIRSDDLIWNMSDGSVGKITTVAEKTLIVDSLLFGDDNRFELGDNYIIPRYNPARGVREGLLGIHEVGKPFKTELDFDWKFTAAASDKTVNDSDILQAYLDGYITENSQSIKDGVGSDMGICVWFKPDVADCFAHDRDFVIISGNITESNTGIVTDDKATFKKDYIKPGDIVQIYDNETDLVYSGEMTDLANGTTTNSVNDATLPVSNNSTLLNTDDNLTQEIGNNLMSIEEGSMALLQTSGSSPGGGTNDDSSRPRLYDVNANFSDYKPYSYVVRNETQELESGQAKIQGILANVIDPNTLEVEPYSGEGTEPIRFRPGDRYHIYRPAKFVVNAVSSETELTTVNYESPTTPDFNKGDYYRIISAARSSNGNVGSVLSGGTSSTIKSGSSTVKSGETSSKTKSGSSTVESGETSSTIKSGSSTVKSGETSSKTKSGSSTVTSGRTEDTLEDGSVDFLKKGIEKGDIIENHAGAFGEISNVTENNITTTLYGGTSNDFSPGEKYTIYYNHVFSREHILRAKFKGKEVIKTVSEERKRAVCLGYDNDCNIDKPVKFSGNNGKPLVTIIDYQEDDTEVGNAHFTPSSASMGSLRVSNINFYLEENEDRFPEWFIANDWHKLIYVAISEGDAPGSGLDCNAGTGTNCLTLTGAGRPDDKNAIVIAAGRPIDTVLDEDCNSISSRHQNRVNGTINEYLESENCTAGDDEFEKQFASDTFNDQIRVVTP